MFVTWINTTGNTHAWDTDSTDSILATESGDRGYLTAYTDFGKKLSMAEFSSLDLAEQVLAAILDHDAHDEPRPFDVRDFIADLAENL